MAAVLPPLSDPANSQFLRPTATDLKARSAALLSISIFPLLKNGNASRKRKLKHVKTIKLYF